MPENRDSAKMIAESKYEQLVKELAEEKAYSKMLKNKLLDASLALYMQTVELDYLKHQSEPE